MEVAVLVAHWDVEWRGEGSSLLWDIFDDGEITEILYG